jgi:hypothetical protein
MIMYNIFLRRSNYQFIVITSIFGPLKVQAELIQCLLVSYKSHNRNIIGKILEIFIE